jgi:hypothetical protein
MRTTSVAVHCSSGGFLARALCSSCVARSAGFVDQKRFVAAVAAAAATLTAAERPAAVSQPLSAGFGLRDPTSATSRAGLGASVGRACTPSTSATPTSTPINTPAADGLVARGLSLREGELQRWEAELAQREQLVSSALAPAGGFVTCASLRRPNAHRGRPCIRVRWCCGLAHAIARLSL